MMNYSNHYVRSSEALCRTALDIILIECLTVIVRLLDSLALKLSYKLLTPQKSGDTVVGTSEVSAHQPSTPGPWGDIRVYGEISFNHKTLFESTSTSTPAGTIISGCVDYGIGRVLIGDAQKLRFQSLLVIVEAKTSYGVDEALPQLLAYLACLHQSRQRRGRHDASVYGVASDGFLFRFVKITHDGVVKISRQFDVLYAEIEQILGCLRYILELTVGMSLNVTPERKSGNEMDIEDSSDESFDMGENAYTTAPSP